MTIEKVYQTSPIVLNVSHSCCIVEANSTVIFVVGTLELTVTWEDWMEEANERKKAQYLELVAQCLSHRWRPKCEPVEVGL